MASVPPGVPVVVVDNASTDGSAEAARDAGAARRRGRREPRLRPRLQPRGPRGTRPGLRGDPLPESRRGARRRGGRPGGAPRRRARTPTPTVAAAAPRLTGDGQEEFQLRRLPSLGSLAREAFLVNRLLPGNRRLPRRAVPGPVPRGAVRRRAAGGRCAPRSPRGLGRLGGFDPAFAPAGSRTSTSARGSSSQGYRIRFVPGAAAGPRGRSRDGHPLLARLLPGLHAQPVPLPGPARVRARCAAAWAAAAPRCRDAPRDWPSRPRGDHRRADVVAARYASSGVSSASASSRRSSRSPHDLARPHLPRDAQRGADAERLVPSLFAQTFRDVAVSVVDNASEDGTRATLAAFEKVAPFPLEVFPSRENLGSRAATTGPSRRPSNGGSRGSSS